MYLNTVYLNICFDFHVKVRWLASQSRALNALKSNLKVIVMHMDEAASRTDLYAGVAKNYLSNLKNANMLKTMFLLLDILCILADLSKVTNFNH